MKRTINDVELDIGPGADLSDVDLSDADLGGANLRDANLSRCILCDANLDGAWISYRGKVVTIRFEETK